MDQIVDAKNRLLIVTNNLPERVGRPRPGDTGPYFDFSADVVQAAKTLLTDMGCEAEVLPFSEQGIRDHVAEAQRDGRAVSAVIDLFEPSAENVEIDALPNLLDDLGLDHCGSDVASRILQRDKGLSKQTAQDAGALTAPWIRVSDVGELGDGADIDPLLPVIIKPNAATVSQSIYRADTRDEAVTYAARAIEETGDDVLIESFVPGTEITVMRIGNGDTAEVVPLILVWERKSLPPADFIFLQDDKFGNSPKGKRCNWRLARAFLDETVCDQLEETTRMLADAFDGRDFIRMDFRVRPDGAIYFIETNAQPNLNDHFGTTLYAVNRDFYRSKQEVQRRYLRAALDRMGVAQAYV